MNKKNISKKIKALRKKMSAYGIGLYIVPTADFHGSEYVGDYFKAREYMTGFTGSAGTAVFAKNESLLWTDGRYFVQAEAELMGTPIRLMKMGQGGVPTVEEYVKKALPDGGCIGFDGRTVTARFGQKMEKIAEEKAGEICADIDIVGEIWEDRPPISEKPAWILDKKYAGESTADKISRLREKMSEAGADVHILSTLDDIAWLLNIRGDDIHCVPVVLSYLAVGRDFVYWFVQDGALSDEVNLYLKKNNVTAKNYVGFYDYVASLYNEKILLDERRVNYRIIKEIPASATVIGKENPTELMKAKKNETELTNIKKAHIKDAVAVCRFMKWLKENVGKVSMTELSAQRKLLEFRRQQEGFIDESFDAICAYGPHGAIVHYEASEESNVDILPEGLLLVDSGGHYLEGTTDITRTFALGEITEEMRSDFTRVCRANLNLAAAKFLYGCTGRNLDILARGPLWEAGKDFKHGTGHGVGYALCVHEGPNAFRWRKPKADDDTECVLEAGMVTTDEPGIYIVGEYGIRLENELVCVEDEKNDYGQFMSFETITYVPFDLDAIDAAQMQPIEIERLNNYHRSVYETVSPYLSDDEKIWLKTATREI
ncbi:MAG: aminopeptidase P family protein [Clostridiales bacterium]|nr:aminopeptidase P family protein [Clostridiales bacterium]